MSNPIRNAYDKLAGTHDKIRNQIMAFSENHYAPIDGSFAQNSLNKAQEDLTEALAEGSKFFPETALPSDPEARKEVLLDFIHIQMGERNNRLKQRPLSQQDTDFTQAGTKNQSHSIGALYQNDQIAGQKLNDRYGQAKQLEPQFLRDAEDAPAWLQKCQDLEESQIHHEYALAQHDNNTATTEQSQAHDEYAQTLQANISALNELKENGTTGLTNEELDDANTLLQSLEPHKIATEVANIKEKLPRLRVLGSEETTPEFNRSMAELDRERVALYDAHTNLKAQPESSNLKEELKHHQAHFDEALINVRKNLAEVDSNLLKTANITHSNFQDVCDSLEKMRHASKPWPHSQVLNWWNLKKNPGSIGTDINSLEISKSNTLWIWEYQRTGDVIKVPHYHKDKNGNSVPTKLSPQALLAAATRAEADPELRKKYGPIKTKITRDHNGNITHVKVTCGSEQQKQSFISEMCIPMQQQLDKEHQAKIEGEEEGADAKGGASATLQNPEPAPGEGAADPSAENETAVTVTDSDESPRHAFRQQQDPSLFSGADDSSPEKPAEEEAPTLGS